MPMLGPAQSTGRLLGSVAMRYQRAAAAWEWPPPVGSGLAWTGWTMAPQDEDVPGAGGPTARCPRLARLEAVLLLSDQPLGSRKIAELADLADGTEARTLVGALNRLYDAEGCAFHVVEVAGGFHLMSRPQFAPWLKRLQTSPVEVRLSAPAIETLAVVAYRQPVLRAEVEAIRGVQCGEILRQLMERDLIRIAGRSEELGRPFLYGTTKRFLQVFGLRHLDELPRPQLARSVGPDKQPADDGTGSRQSCAGEERSIQVTSQTEEEPNVKSSARLKIVPDEIADQAAMVALEDQPNQSLPDDKDEDDDVDDEEEFDDDDDLEEEDDEEDDLEEEDDGELDDEWEEVTDEDEEDEDEDEDDEDEDDDWDDDEDEDDDWDDDEEDDDWGDDDDDDDDKDKDKDKDKNEP